MPRISKIVVTILVISNLAWIGVCLAKVNPKPLSSELNKLSETEQAEGWQLLFDGKTVDGWNTIDGKKVQQGCWKVADGELTILKSDKGKSRCGGDIITESQYQNFELRLEFKIHGKANSGIKYFVQPNSSIGFEYQILDERPNQKGAHRTADLYDLVLSHNRHPSPVGEWNAARIVVRGSIVEHWLNGVKVLEIDRSTPEFAERIQESKFRERKGFGKATSGYILLQDHGGGVSFRNIKIKVL